MSCNETSLCLSISDNDYEASAYVWLDKGGREGGRSLVENHVEIQIYLPFKDQMLHRRPPSYPNHLFVFIAFLLSRCHPACVNPIVLHLLEESFFEKLQVMLKQGRCHRLHRTHTNTKKTKNAQSFGEVASNAAAKVTSQAA